MKHPDTKGISFIAEPFGGDGSWYFGINYEQGDLYEAEEIFRAGGDVKGRRFCLIRCPDGEVFWPVEKRAGAYPGEAVQEGGRIYFPEADFTEGLLRIIGFDCESHEVKTEAEILLSEIRDCYNLRLSVRPLTLTRQGGEDKLFEVIWPEKASFPLHPHESFFLRDGEKLYFNHWYEEGEGGDYRFWEETVVRNLQGEVLETLPGDVRLMPDGELWHLG